MSEAATADIPHPFPDLPDGDYAIVELLGHRTLVGRISEIERFGSKLLQIEPIWRDQLLTPTLHHGNSIYGLTPCSRDVARQRQAKHEYQLPAPVLATIAPEALPAPPAPATVETLVDEFTDVEPDDSDEEPF